MLIFHEIYSCVVNYITCWSSVTLLFRNELGWASLIYRGMHIINRFDWGSDKCIVCKLCEVVCPAYAIVIVSNVSLSLFRQYYCYSLDLVKCIYCGCCAEVCPVDAIDEVWFNEFIFSCIDSYWVDHCWLSMNGSLII